jgi:L-lactate dehydrogenase complex protein LldE
MRVALFITCYNDLMYPEVGQAIVRLVRRLGHEVEFPAEQTCCGQMHGNSGFREDALALAARLVWVFRDDQAIVCPSASCVGWVRDIAPALAREAGDAELAEQLDRLAARTFELTEFLCDELGVEDVGATFPHRVAYHPTCHSQRGLQLGDRPRRLLRAVRGLELVEVAGEDCCGFGGTFAVKNADVSAAMLADKLGAIEATGADVCTAVDSSCLMQISGGLRRQRSGMRTLHVAEILAARA